MLPDGGFFFPLHFKSGEYLPNQRRPMYVDALLRWSARRQFASQNVDIKVLASGFLGGMDAPPRATLDV